MKKIYKIYAIKHPISKEIRYIGVTTSTLQRRLYQHIHSAKTIKGRHICHWIKSLLDDNLYPEIELIEEANEENWELREQYYIATIKNLTNSHKGGKGVIINRSYTSIERSANAKKISIMQLSEDGSLIKEWDSVKEAVRFFGGKSESSISNVLKKNRGAVRAFGFKWAYRDDYANNRYTVRYDAPKVDYSKIKPVATFDQDGNIIKSYKSLNLLVKDLSPNLRNYSAAKKALDKNGNFKGCKIKYI